MKSDQNLDTPGDLTALEYARGLLENTLGWPAKGNLEMMADCITSLSKAKKLTLPQSLAYLERAVKLAKQQNITVDRFFFQGGDYTNVRPTVSRSLPEFKQPDLGAIKAEQATPEWKAASDRARRMLKRLCEAKVMG